MRRAFFAATAFLSLATTGQAALAADDTPEAPYVDDRSSADAVVRSLYSAINRHEFARAWGYFGDTKPAKDFDSFVKGYDGTDKVEVETGAVSDEGAAGSIFYNVPVAIRATDKDRRRKGLCRLLHAAPGQCPDPGSAALRSDPHRQRAR